MYFESMAELWAMAGHGPFVWSAYAITFVVILALIIMPLQQMTEFKREERRRARRDQALREQSSGD